MKKLMMFVLCLAAIQAVACSANGKRIEFSQLPEQSKQFINTHFTNRPVAMVKVDNDIFNKSYEVIFTDGSTVEFDRGGLWKEVDCKYSEVPATIVPERIMTFIKREYSTAAVTHIEKKKRGRYEVDLSNGLELTFDSNFNLIDIDD